jgi:tetratricopeptide (TPR) repeat protein
MKQLLWFFFFSVLLISGVFSQTIERPKKEISLITEPVAELTEAEGWMLQNNGEWVSSKNKIPFRNYGDNKKRGGLYNLGKENFDLISVRSITIDEVVYSILLVYFQQGEYQFPLLRENWMQYNSVAYYVFDEQIWPRIFHDSIVYNKPYAVNTDLLCQGTIVDFNEGTYLFDIENHIRQSIYQRDVSITTMIFAAFPVNIRGQKYFRFKLYESINKREMYVKFLLERNWPKLFQTFYYEVELSEFEAFFNNLHIIDQSKLDDPSYYTSFLNSGIEKFNNEEYKSSVQSFTKALMVNPADTALIPIYYWRGKSKLELNVYDEAFEDLNYAISIEPTTSTEKSIWLAAHYERGNAYNGQHEYQQACEDWNFALQNGHREAFDKIKTYCGKVSEDGSLAINIKKSERFFDRALQRFNRGKYLKAIDLFEKAWRNNHLTRNFKIPYYIGLSRYNLGDFVRSIDDFNKAVSMQPDSSAPDFAFWHNSLIQRGLAWQQIGNEYEACHDWHQAKQSGDETAIDLFETYCLAFNFNKVEESSETVNPEELAISYYNSGNFEEAIELLSQQIAAAPDTNNLALFNLRAKAKHKTGDFDGATEDFTVVVIHTPNDKKFAVQRASAIFNRGVSKFFAGYLNEACDDWKKAIEEGLQDVNAFEYIDTYCAP